MSGRVAGKVALITGGASGFGRAAAGLFVREGARVIITDRDEAGGLATARALGDAARFLTQDVTQEDSWPAVIGSIAAQEGQLNILVNNAGIGLFRSVTEMTLKEWRHVQAVNSDAVFLGCKYALPLMQKSPGGSIVNISSVAGLSGSPLMTAYCASKGAVRLFTKALAMELAHGKVDIRVNSVHPAYVETPLVHGHIAASPDPEKTRRMLERVHPIGRMGTVDEIANGILFLASDESRFMTGAELVLDGGVTAQ